MPLIYSNSPARQHQRPGFSLIEVIVAMAICMLGLAAVLQMSNLSQRFARKATEAVDLQILCQNRVNELLAGLLPLENSSEQPCPENELYVYSIEVDLQEQLPLALVVVTVQPTKDGASTTNSRNSELTERANRKREERERQFVIRRWVSTPNQSALEQSPTDSPPNPQTGLPSTSPTPDEDRP